MITLRWSDDLLVGVEVMDEQHKVLVRLIGEFYRALGEKGARDALRDLLTGMLDYTEFHFGTEEELMRRSSYPQYEEHLAQHESFHKKTIDMLERHVRGEMVLSLEATNYLQSWLLEHIRATDHRLGEHLQHWSYR